MVNPPPANAIPMPDSDTAADGQAASPDTGHGMLSAILDLHAATSAGQGVDPGSPDAIAVSPHYLRILRTLSACSRVVMRATDECELLAAICNTLVDTGGYAYSWVGYKLDDQAKTVQPMAQTGFRPGFLGPDEGVSWDGATAAGRGVFGQAINTGKPAVLRGVRDNEVFGPWQKFAQRYNFNAALGLPIHVNDQVIGVIGFYSADMQAFGATEVALLGEVARDLSHGISVIRLRREKEAAQAGLEAANLRLEQKVAERTQALQESEERYALALRGAQECVWEWFPLSGELHLSERAASILGCATQALPSHIAHYAALIHPEDIAPGRQILMSYLKGHAEYCELEQRIRTCGGNYIWLSLRGVGLRDDSGRVYRVVGSAGDISARKQAEALLAQEKERALVTLQAITDAVLTTDMHGRVDYMNPAAERLTGWSQAAASMQPLHDVFRMQDEATMEALPDPALAICAQGESFGISKTALLLRRDGVEFAIQWSAAPIRDADSRTIGAVLVAHDVTESRRAAAQLAHQARHDALTGLINRREFDQRLQNLLDSPDIGERRHALLYLDLDQFKIVNDTCGHTAGDELLRQLSSILQNQLRAADTLARLGGDEFGILLENCAAEPALHVAEALRQAVSEFHFVWHDKTFTVGASIGLVSFGGDIRCQTDILSAADTACYVAKDTGRNRVHVYRPDDRETASRHGEMQWVGRIRHALAANRFRLYYQPIAPVAGSHALHVELLVRLQDENGEIVPPMAFIPAAERYNLMSLVDRWVIRQALSQFDRLYPETGQPLELCAINLSGTSLSDDTFAEFIKEQLALHPAAAGRICFEITETAAIANLAKAAALIQDLKALGCRFALDDFGSGMSSFGYLKHLPVDFLKIDGGFVKDMVHDQVDAAMVEAINNIGHVMGIRTIAEFVENDAILERLQQLGVDFAQGYGIGKPMPCGGTYETAAANKEPDC